MSLILPRAPQFSLYDTSTMPATPGEPGGVTVSNPAGAANTKNTTWTQLIASTAFDAQLVVIYVGSSSAAATDTSTLLDIGIGASTAETVIIPDLLAGGTGASNVGGRHYIFPLYIPAGSRLSARSQSVRTTGSTLVSVQLYGGPRDPANWWCGTQVTAYGISTADSGGTLVTAGNSGSEGSVVSIGTTSADHECLVVGMQPTGTTTASVQYHFDVGIDTTSTAWLVRDLFMRTDTSERMWSSGFVWWPIYSHIPSGSVLVAAGECSGTADAATDLAIYGVS